MKEEGKTVKEEGKTVEGEAAPAVDGAAGHEAGSNLGKALRDEIDSSVTAAMDAIHEAQKKAAQESATDLDASKPSKPVEKKPESAAPAAKKDDLPPDDDSEDEADDGGEAPTDGEDADEDEADGEESPVVADDLLTRAVRAGMSLAEARSFKDADALGRVCGLLEAKNTKDAKADGGEKDESGEEDPLAGIPDLNPDDYDEGVVSAVKALKDVIRKQHEQLKTILAGQADKEKSSEQNWIESKIAGLGEEFEAAVGKGPTAKLDPKGPQAQKRAALESKVKVLTAGYKAAGENMDRDSIFQEAISMVLGDVVKQSSDDKKAKALSKRASQHTVRPGGINVKPTGDAATEVADTIDRKFFGKT